MKRFPLHRVIVPSVVSLVAIAFAGCSASYDSLTLSRETFTVNAPHTVMDSPQVERVRAARPAVAASVPLNEHGQPWWTNRNDERLAVRPGSDEVTYSAYRVYVRDRQYSYDGNIRNIYRREVRSITTGQGGY